MDSGSLQSSSGGEEEYDSQQGQLLSHSALFDHNFQQSLALTALNSQYNNNALLWPLGMGLRSQPSLISSQPLLEQPLVETTNVVGRSSQGHSLPSDQPKNPKKRSRASRRAPTTVLTTDTTNFRQMVQEFTGIPAGPFSGGSAGGGSLYSRRLDLFSTAGSSMRTAHFDPLGGALQHHGLLIHKLSGQSVETSGVNDSTFCHKKAEMPSFIPSSFSTNFQLSNEVGVTKQQSSALFNMEEDQILTFQPLLQSSLKNPMGNHGPNEPVFGSKSRGSNSHLSAIDGLGISHEQASVSLSGFLGQGSANSDQARNCSTSSALELHNPHDKGLENGVCSGGDGDAAGSSWPCPK